MNIRSRVVAIGFFVLFFLAGSGGMAVAQHSSPPMSMAPVDPRQFLVDGLDLKIYEAATGDLSLCADDEYCLRRTKKIRSWLCAAGVCDGADKSKRPLDCFEGVTDAYKKIRDQIDASVCSFIKSPGARTRRALMTLIPDEKENELVEYRAYLFALKGSAVSCEDYIKNYVGAYGPQWNYKWYRALSGCRILAHDRTRAQEANDFYVWFGVVQRSGSCSDIVNSEMRNACNAPGATSPIPRYNE